jgi:D-alanyl-D-alanine carboxypeptidase (penicillin-binding protein 5/6)
MLTNKREVTFFVVLVMILFALLGATYFVGDKVIRADLAEPAKVVVNPFDSVTLTAKAAYVLDVRTGKVLFEKNSDDILPLASLTKVMTALVATTLAGPTQTITITKEAIDTEGDSGLQVGEKWSLKNLLDFSLASSSNDGARAIALSLGDLGDLNSTSASSSENNFIKDMNAEAKKIGMNQTYYINDTGLDQSTVQGGAYGTAKNMAMLFNYILKNYPNMMEATREASFQIASESGIMHTAINTDAIVNSIPGLIASKTGYTDLAGGNLVIAFDPEIGRPIIISVLGSTEDGRFEDVSKLVAASLESLQNSVKSAQ